MKRLLLVLVLLCSVAMSYAQVLKDVKPLGIPLGIDEETAFEILKEQGAVQEAEIPDLLKEKRLQFNLKTRFAGVQMEYVALGIFGGKIMSLTIATTEAVYDKLRQNLSQQYGTAIANEESEDKLLTWSIRSGDGKREIAHLHLEHNQQGGFVSVVYQHLPLLTEYVDAAFAEL